MLTAVPGALTAALQVHGPGDMMAGAGWMMWGVWLFGVLFWVAVFGLVVVVIWKLVAGSSVGTSGSDASRGAGSGDRDAALAILEQRYARGEIGREEFLEMREDLRGE